MQFMQGGDVNKVDVPELIELLLFGVVQFDATSARLFVQFNSFLEPRVSLGNSHLNTSVLGKRPPLIYVLSVKKMSCIKSETHLFLLADLRAHVVGVIFAGVASRHLLFVVAVRQVLLSFENLK